MALSSLNTNDLELSAKALKEIIEHYQITSFVSDEEISSMQKIHRSLLSGKVDEMWDCVCDHAVEFIDDIEDQPEWFECIYDLVRVMNQPEFHRLENLA